MDRTVLQAYTARTPIAFGLSMLLGCAVGLCPFTSPGAAAQVAGFGDSPAADPAASEETRRADAGGPVEVAALIRDLGDPSYEKRTAATRRLCMIGSAAVPALRQAARSPDAEVALRAASILEALDALFFHHVSVELRFTNSSIRWNEPVDLQVTMFNSGDHPARVPFELAPQDRARLTPDARQVGDLLDLAEYLHVRRNDGRTIDLRVDDIAADPDVEHAVRRRVRAGPASTLEPGTRVTVVARDFNRGWARYPLLDAGEYRVTLEYVPQWDDEVLAAGRVGRVVSNEVSIVVTESAPANVSRHGREAAMELTQDADSLVATVRNTYDLPLRVNANFGTGPPFAQARWVVRSDAVRREIPIVPVPGASWHDFMPDRLVQVEPGGSLELARIELARLHAMLPADAPPGDARGTVHFSYTNLCNRVWQRKQRPALFSNSDAPAFFRRPLPRRIYGVHQTSNTLPITP